MKNMNDLLRQAQVMQNKIARLQQEMAEKDVEASAGGGMVKVVMNGRQEMKSIVIDKAVMESGDNEMLQDLVMT
ncbi:MAG: YbaB/EbfC family nucleoid-associated protein, partial [Mailhella sp.]|nr:YbaB/EbfC family nucleoid-associated protein [Mailhella sp.]